MKFFIFVCCTAHLLTGISSRIRRTTPMSSELRSNDAEARQVANFAEMIDFVNSVPNNDDERTFFRRNRPSKRQVSRRLNEVMAALYGFADLKKFHDDVDTGAAVKKMEDKVRYHIIDNPEVLMNYKDKQKNNNVKGILDQENAPIDAFKFNTAENKFIKTDPEVAHDNPNVTSHDNATVNLKTQDNVQEPTTVEKIYRPSFSDDEDDDKPIVEGITLINNEKQNSEPKTDEVDHDERRSVINKTDEFEKRIQNKTPSSKEDKARIDKKKADTYDSKGTSTKKEEDKEYGSTKFIYSQEKLIEDRIRPHYEVDDKLNKEDGNTNEDTDEDKNQKSKSWDINEKNLTSVERLIFKINNRINKNHDRAEQYSIYSHKDRRENSNKHSRKSHKDREKYDKRKKFNYYGERESQWIKVDNQKDYKESLRDENDDKWSKKERDWDKKYDKWRKKEKESDENYNIGSKKAKDWGEIDDRLIKKEKDWDKMNDRWDKKEKDWDEIDEKWKKKQKSRDKNDERWTKETKYWNNKNSDHEDKDADTMEYEWNKRHQEYDKHKNDAQWYDNDKEGNENNFKERDIDFKKRDSEFNTRDNDLTKRDNGGNKNIGRTYDRNESGKSYESIDNDRDVRHDRYKIVDRIDSDSSRNDDYERSF